ncbi:hypothetical protein ACFXTH_022036 [Malus domestica]
MHPLLYHLQPVLLGIPKEVGVSSKCLDEDTISVAVRHNPNRRHVFISLKSTLNLAGSGIGLNDSGVGDNGG